MHNQTYIIAEAGVNHNGSLALAKQLIDIASEAGADAVKFQTFTAENLVCAHAPKADYQKAATSAAESQLAMLKTLELSKDEQIQLLNYCKTKQIDFLSSPFDLLSANFLAADLALPLIKIASGEITNFPMLYAIAQKGNAVLLSSGMSTLGDIENALKALCFGYLHPEHTAKPSLRDCEVAYFSAVGQEILQQKVSLLHCTSNYPAAFNEINLRAMDTMHQAFGLRVGYSDHTQGITIALAAVARGATIIEKHFTLDRNLPGPDHQASLEPTELKAMVQGIRQIEEALGNGKKLPTASELNTRLIARKSVVALEKIQKGELLTEQNLGCKRPGTGVSPMFYYDLAGKTAERDYEPEELVGV